MVFSGSMPRGIDPRRHSLDPSALREGNSYKKYITEIQMEILRNVELISSEINRYK